MCVCLYLAMMMTGWCHQRLNNGENNRNKEDDLNEMELQSHCGVSKALNDEAGVTSLSVEGT